MGLITYMLITSRSTLTAFHYSFSSQVSNCKKKLTYPTDPYCLSVSSIFHFKLETVLVSLDCNALVYYVKWFCPLLAEQWPCNEVCNCLIAISKSRRRSATVCSTEGLIKKRTGLTVLLIPLLVLSIRETGILKREKTVCYRLLWCGHWKEGSSLFKVTLHILQSVACNMLATLFAKMSPLSTVKWWANGHLLYEKLLHLLLLTDIDSYIPNAQHGLSTSASLYLIFVFITTFFAYLISTFKNFSKKDQSCIIDFHYNKYHHKQLNYTESSSPSRHTHLNHKTRLQTSFL